MNLPRNAHEFAEREKETTTTNSESNLFSPIVLRQSLSDIFDSYCFDSFKCMILFDCCKIFIIILFVVVVVVVLYIYSFGYVSKHIKPENFYDAMTFPENASCICTRVLIDILEARISLYPWNSVLVYYIIYNKFYVVIIHPLAQFNFHLFEFIYSVFISLSLVCTLFTPKNKNKSWWKSKCSW